MFMNPTVETFKKACFMCRYSAKNDRILFHYNGHGVPKPTENGELWFFNKDSTKYTPFSIYSVHECLGSPTVCVFDCNNAGLIIKWFMRYHEQSLMEEKLRQAAGNVNESNADTVTVQDAHILLGACSVNEMLSTNPEMPADIFTCCLTTPIQINLRWYVSRTYIPGITLDLINQIPGCLNDRRTLLGELNWIFTAITDTIAWNILPSADFYRLFRQDLLVACLLRNYFLAERIMRSCNCVSVSVPRFPATYDHVLWQSWDAVLDWYLAQLPDFVNNPSVQFRRSTFFDEQLTSFETWLELASENPSSPPYLPILPQVLLSQIYRIRALNLLAKFLDLGSWAVDECYNVGMFPYVLKLLQSPALEIRPLLLFIWSKIIASYRACQVSIVGENLHHYFLNVLKIVKAPLSERLHATFVLALLCDNFVNGKKALLAAKVFSICIPLLSDPDPLLRRWVVLLFAKIWENFGEAKRVAASNFVHEKLCRLLKDPVSQVRTTVVYALSTFVAGAPMFPEIQIKLGLTIPVLNMDACPLVRRELAVALAHWVNIYREVFISLVRRRSKAKNVSKKMAVIKNSMLHVEKKSNYRKISKRLQGVEKETQDEEAMDYSDMMAAYAECNWESDSDSVSVEFNVPLLCKRSYLVEDSELYREGITKSGGDNVDTENNNFNKNPLSHSVGVSSLSDQMVFDLLWKNVIMLSKDPEDQVARTARILIAYYMKLAFQKGVNNEAVFSADDQVQESKMTRMLSDTIYKNSPLSLSMSSISKYTKAKSDVLRDVRGSACDDFWVDAGMVKGSQEETLETQLVEEIDLNKPLLEYPEFKSVIFEWSCHAWSEPSTSMERQIKRAKMFWSTQRTFDAADESCNESVWLTPSQQLKDEIAIFHNNSNYSYKNLSINNLNFHLFKPIVFVCNGREINAWNWKDSERVVNIDCGSLSHIDSVDLLNEAYSVLVATGHEDLCVRVWDNVYQKPKILTAWNVLGDVPALSSTESKLVLEWQVRQERLAVTGNFNLVRIWNLVNEMIERDLPTSFETPITSMTTDKDGNLIMVGNSCGSIQLFDLRRKNPLSAALNAYEGHKILGLSSTKILQEMFISGATNGEIKFWDLRNWGTSIRTISTSPSSTLTIHKNLPIFAFGTLKQKIEIFNFSGDSLSTIMYHEGFLGRKIAPVSCLNFHAYYPLLVSSEFGSLISVYAGKSFKTSANSVTY